MPRVYIGRLSYQARERDVERFFKGYARFGPTRLGLSVDGRCRWSALGVGGCMAVRIFRMAGESVGRRVVSIKGREGRVPCVTWGRPVMGGEEESSRAALQRRTCGSWRMKN
uniref:RRM domain-containing protein n=1 Tax=Meleagris gallopavo TaxID=9103 RepID=A0A803YB84_MELGA